MAKTRSFFFAPAALACLAVASCTSSGAGSISRCLASGEKVLPASATTTATPGAYALGSGDRLRITVFGETDLSGEFEVDGSGKISMPLVGQFTAAGLTTVRLESAISDLLKRGDYVLNPRVSAEVINYRPFYVFGEVNTSGEYPYTSNLTVVKAVATAGGFNYRANTKVVKIKHIDATEEVAYELTPTTMVSPGDTLRICERIF
jgi:protein involved in polysaccharide export with SLBB domain